MSPSRGVARRVLPGLLLLLATGCEHYESLRALPAPVLRTHYLIDFEYYRDAARLLEASGYLLIFNPGSREVPLDVTVYFEDREPQRFQLTARAGATTWSSVTEWPVKPEGRFALAVASAEPVIVQASIQWDNTGGDLGSKAAARSAAGRREAATSYTAIPDLAERWYLADGLVIDKPEESWLRESEGTIVLNPGDAPARVTLTTFYRWFVRQHTIEVPPRRVRHVRMDDIVLANRHYGLRVASDRPVAVQSRRTMYWYDSTELMSFWSVPLVPLARDLLEGAAPTPAPAPTAG